VTAELHPKHNPRRTGPEAATMADLSARLLRARLHAAGLLAHLEAVDHRAEAKAARTLLELLDGRWAR
jgi:hypothetical protein